MNHRDCPRWKSIVERMALGEEPRAGDAAFVREHPRTCALCAREAALWRAVEGLAPRRELDEATERAMIAAALRGAPAAGAHDRRWLPWAAGGLALAAAAFALWLRPHQQPPPDQIAAVVGKAPMPPTGGRPLLSADAETAIAGAGPATEPASGTAARAGDRTSALLNLAAALRERGRVRDANGIYRALERASQGNPDVKAAVAALQAPPRAPSGPRPPPAVYRINAGGPRYVDASGTVWEGDSHFDRGTTSRFNHDIDGTDMDPLYQTGRVPTGRPSVLRYAFPVSTGDYTVRLHFAEVWVDAMRPGRRVFDVVVEGVKVLSDYDITGDVGFLAAAVKQFPATVSDGKLDIEFASGSVGGQVTLARVSAIEVLPGQVPAPPASRPAARGPLPLPPSDALYRINVGGREYVDPEGRLWQQDDHYEDVAGIAAAAEDIDLGSTELDAVYNSWRYADPPATELRYSLAVARGQYRVRLHFCDLLRQRRGQRVFDVAAEGVVLLPGYDVVGDVGPKRPAVKEIDVSVTDGALDLALRAVVGTPILSGIEVFAKAPAAVTPSPPPAEAAATPATSEAPGCAVGRQIGRAGQSGGGAPTLAVVIALFSLVQGGRSRGTRHSHRRDANTLLPRSGHGRSLVPRRDRRRRGWRLRNQRW
jgi:hypothetical protein